jgi:hypothetical protein
MIERVAQRVRRRAMSAAGIREKNENMTRGHK